MKKILSLILLLVVVLGLVACGKDSSANVTKDDYTNITVSNCNYYLSIDDSLIKSDNGYAAGKRWVSITRKITINGAISGVYSDCTITFEYGENKTQKTIELNAAGYASFEYKINNSSYTAKIVSCTGKLYL
ncbi:MAG: hypothetical protein VZQ61_00535 [Christensenellaceae bacterium]